MQDCCKETYKQTLIEVIHFIRHRPEKSIPSLIKSLEYAIDMLSRLDDEHRELEIKNELVKSFKE